MSTEPFIRGFIKAAQAEGLNEEQATQLYKQAVGFGAGLGSAVKATAPVAASAAKKGMKLPVKTLIGGTAGTAGALGGYSMHGDGATAPAPVQPDLETAKKYLTSLMAQHPYGAPIGLGLAGALGGAALGDDEDKGTDAALGGLAGAGLGLGANYMMNGNFLGGK